MLNLNTGIQISKYLIVASGRKWRKVLSTIPNKLSVKTLAQKLVIFPQQDSIPQRWKLTIDLTLVYKLTIDLTLV
jgi:hypothetical protein